MKSIKLLLFVILPLLLVTIIGCKKTSNDVEPQPPTIKEFTVDSLNYRVNDDSSTVTVTSHISGQQAFGDLLIP